MENKFNAVDISKIEGADEIMEWFAGLSRDVKVLMVYQADRDKLGQFITALIVTAKVKGGFDLDLVAELVEIYQAAEEADAAE